MRRRRRSWRLKGLALVGGILLVLCGCQPGSMGTSHGSSAAASSGQCAGSCAGQDPSVAGCDDNATSPVSKSVAAAGLGGLLELRKAAASVCPGIYWTRFTPNAGNTTPFKLTLLASDQLRQTVPARPNLSEKVWTKTIVGHSGSSLQPCINAGGQQVCTDAYSIP